jgi:hypothetical protein
MITTRKRSVLVGLAALLALAIPAVAPADVAAGNNSNNNHEGGDAWLVSAVIRPAARSQRPRNAQARQLGSTWGTDGSF